MYALDDCVCNCVIFGELELCIYVHCVVAILFGQCMELNIIKLDYRIIINLLRFNCIYDCVCCNCVIWRIGVVYLYALCSCYTNFLEITECLGLLEINEYWMLHVVEIELHYLFSKMAGSC